MDNNAQILSLFGSDVHPDMLSFLQTQNGKPSAYSTPDILTQEPVPAGNIKARIMQELGATEPDQGGIIQNILSGRFNQDGVGSSYGDYAQSAISSLNGKYTPASNIAQNRTQQQLQDISMLERSQYLADGGGGNATLKATQQLMASDPKLDFATAFSIAKSGAGQGNTVVNGQVQNIAGAPEAGGNLQYGKQAGEKRADLEVAAPIAAATASGRTQGEATANAQANLPQVVDQAQQSIKVIDDVLKHPGLAANFGTSGMLPNRPGSEAADAKAYLDQIRGGSFLTAYNQLRGGGQISNTEGAKAEAAYARMTSAQSVNAFKQAAQDYKDIINKVVVRTRNTASGATFNQPATGSPASAAPQSNIVDYTEYFK